MVSSPGFGNLHWLKDIDDEFARGDEQLPREAEVVIVGGGYVGTATALWLARLGVQAVLLERREIATGATGRNAGFIAPGLGMSFASGVERYGAVGATERLEFTRQGRNLALQLIEELAIECDLERAGGLTIAASEEEWTEVQRNVEALHAAGFDYPLLDRDALAEHFVAPVPARFLGALYNPETLLVNPAKLSRGLAIEAKRLGARLFPRTEVWSLTDLPDDSMAVETGRGVVRAGHVVLATNAWSPLLAGYLKDRIAPVRGQVFATVPAPPVFRRAMSTNWGYEYWSQRADGAIVLGGARWAADDRDEGYYAEEVNPVVQQALYGFLTDGFPVLQGIKLARQWAGIMGFSRDGYPFIGPVPGRERLIVAAGYTGHGGPYFAIAGKCVAEKIVNGRTEAPLHHYALDR